MKINSGKSNHSHDAQNGSGLNEMSLIDFFDLLLMVLPRRNLHPFCEQVRSPPLMTSKCHFTLRRDIAN